MSVSARSTAARRGEYAKEQVVRRDLVRRGVPGWLVSATPRARLNHLDRTTPELPLLVLVEDLDDVQPEDLCPNMAAAGFRSEGIRTTEPDAETWDEALSTAHYIATLRGENPDAPTFGFADDVA